MIKKSDFIAYLGVAIMVSFLGGVAVRDQFGADNMRKHSPIATVSAAPAPVNFEKHDQEKIDKMTSKLDIVEKFAFYKYELNRAKEFDPPKSAFEAIGNIQFTYNLVKELMKLKNEVEKEQYASVQIGFSKAELKTLIADVYKTTLEKIDNLNRVGYTNMCIYEGGCFDNRHDTLQTKRGVQVQLTEFNRS